MSNSPAVQIPIAKPPAEHGISGNGQFGASALSHVPEIATAVALTIAHLSDVDMTLAQIAVRLLGGEGLAAATVFDSIKNRRAREKAIQAILYSHGSAEDKGLTNKVINEIDKVRKIRNKFAHGVWGIPSGLADHLIVTESMHWNSLYGAAAQLQATALDQEVVNLLTELLRSEDGSSLSPAHQARATEIALNLSNSPGRQRALDRVFDEGVSDAKAEVWSIDLAWQAVNAAEAASFTATALQICLDRKPEEADQLRRTLLAGGLLAHPPHAFLHNPH